MKGRIQRPVPATPSTVGQGRFPGIPSSFLSSPIWRKCWALVTGSSVPALVREIARPVPMVLSVFSKELLRTLGEALRQFEYVEFADEGRHHLS